MDNEKIFRDSTWTWEIKLSDWAWEIDLPFHIMMGMRKKKIKILMEKIKETKD